MSARAGSISIWHVLMLFVSPEVFTRTRFSETLAAMKTGKCKGTLFLRVPRWSWHILSILLLCAHTFIKIGLYLFAVHWFHIFQVGFSCVYGGLKNLMCALCTDRFIQLKWMGLIIWNKIKAKIIEHKLVSLSSTALWSTEHTVPKFVGDGIMSWNLVRVRTALA